MNHPAPLSAYDLMYGYSKGIFPMADGIDGELYWYAPDPRAIIPIETYRPSHSLRPILNSRKFEVKVNERFEQVIRACGKPRSDEDGIWISEEIVAAYTELHRLGFAHSVETYQDGPLVGGLYGVSLGAGFFGESMFYQVPNASKVAFHYLILILRHLGYELLDTQFTNDNVRRFGAIEIPKKEYLRRLQKALTRPIRFFMPDELQRS